MKGKKQKGVSIELRPREGCGASIVVFNTIQQGMYEKFLNQLNTLEKDLETIQPDSNSQKYVAFGPFDNVIRFDVDDFCMVNQISSMAGVSSQQIQCVYSLWNYAGKDIGKYKKMYKEKHKQNAAASFFPFCCITQLKVQNHLMLGHGPKLEEKVAGLIAERIKDYIDNPKNRAFTGDLEVELMSTLGWDEFFIFMRNTRGFSSMFRPILKCIRPLTLVDLEASSGYEFEIDKGKKTRTKHLFLTSYSTPCFNMELCTIMDNFLAAEMKKKEKGSYINQRELDLDKIYEAVIPGELKELYGSDEIKVSTRLSVKPGHRERVQHVTHMVLKGSRGWPSQGVPVIDDIFSIGRYDMYPWLNTALTCKEFISYFGLLTFSLAGNIPKTEKFYIILKYTQFYNSFTIISYPEESQGFTPCEGSAPPGVDELDEGGFIRQLGYLALGGLDDTETPKIKYDPLMEVYENRDILRKHFPMSILNGLTRIFSLFDSCIMDRFMVDSFLDMYPFMKRVRDIFDTVEYDPEYGTKGLSFKIAAPGKGNESLTIYLPESGGGYDPLTTVFQGAIERFYRGFVHRYMSSYPMMDKNEAGIDYSGRLHRILSAITGMQNLLMDDLDCYNKKGFNVISTMPTIRISRGSFNVTESNVYFLFQVETFFVLHHEIIHTLIHSKEKKGNRLYGIIDDALKSLPPMAEEARDLPRRVLEEMAGDMLALRNIYIDNYMVFGYWYWLMILKFKNRIDSQVILRFLVLSYTMCSECAGVFEKYAGQNGEIYFNDSSQISRLCIEILDRIGCPPSMIEKIKPRIESYASRWRKREAGELKRFNFNFNRIREIFYSIRPGLDSSIREFCYGDSLPAGQVAGENEIDYKSPIRPVIEKKRHQSSSIFLFRHLVSFLYENRESLAYEEDSIINFEPRHQALRRDLLHYRIALINTLQWESLEWKKEMLQENGIRFTVRIKEQNEVGDV